MKTVLKIFLSITISLLIVALLFFTYLLILVKDYKLDEKKLTTVVKKYEFYDNYNNLVYEDATGGKNKYISIDKLNKHTIDAFIAIEDRKFFSHSGIDYKRIAGATLKNLKSKSLKEGASTISQQLIKNTHLNNEKTLKRKVAEIKITKELENKFTKKQILEKYLNTIYFGKNAYGINEASLLYFNKSASLLDINESAMLAGIIKSPNVYSPLNSITNAVNRKNVVLKAMLSANYISKGEYEEYKDKKLNFNFKNNENYLKNYLTAVKQELEEIISLNLYENSVIKIQTYLDSSVQKNLVETTIDDVNNIGVSKIVINNKNNGVIAYFGENSKLKRCPASTVKPWLVYAPMINEKYVTASSVINDEKININGYSPKNYGDKYYGNITVKDALKYSLNVPPVKLLDGFGIKKVNKYLNKMGINIKNEGLSVALGSINGGMTLKEICDAYSPFNNDGNYIKSQFIKSVSVNGKTVYKNVNDKINVFSKETSFIINDILKECAKTGTSKKLKDFDFDLCAKSGTNGNEDGNLDAYSISYTTEHIIGVWLGNVDNSIIDNKITGGSYPTIFNKEIVKFLYKDKKPSSFEIPKNVISLKVDKDNLIKNSESLICDDGESFYYILGTEPTSVKDLKFKFLSSETSLNNNLVEIKNSSINCEKLKIIRTYKGTSKTVYDGAYLDKYIDALSDYGIYEYSLIFYDKDGNEYPFKTKSINFSKNSLDIIKNEWWNL